MSRGDHALISALVPVVMERSGRRTGNEIAFKCPNPEHEDTHPSASFNVESGLYYCHGCEEKGNARKLATRLDIDRGKRESKSRPTPASGGIPAKWYGKRRTGTWAYRDRDGEELFVVARFDDADGKTVIPFIKDGAKYRAKGPETPLPLFHLDQINARFDDRVFVVEGEKCAEAITVLGGLATTSQGGSGRAHKSDWSALAGRDVAIWPDHDAAGAKYLAQVLQQLSALVPAPQVRVVDVEALALPPKGDVVDFLARQPGATLDTVMAVPMLGAPPLADAAIVRYAEAGARMYEQDDVGNAERLRDKHGARFRHCPAVGWLAWDGTRWRPDPNEVLIRRAAMDIGKDLYAEARAAADAGDKAPLKNASRSGRRAQVDAMIDLAGTLLNAAVGEFDRDPYVANVANGIVDLRTGELQPHRPEALLTKISPVAYDPEAVCPLWDAFLNRVLRGDGSVIDYLREVAGYALTGSIEEQCFFIFYGPGQNGKTVCTETLAYVFGEYAATAEMESLQVGERSRGAARNDLASLAGARLVLASEPDASARLSEPLIKLLTGGETLKVRFLYKEYFDLRPTFTIICSANYLPRVQGTDEGIWRRIRVVPFREYIPEDERDPQLLDKLKAEAPGILRWCVEGAVRWRRRGRLETPLAVRQASAVYRSEQDTFQEFLIDCCDTTDSLTEVTARTLYDAYLGWCSQNAERPLSAAHFGRALDQRGFPSRRGGGGTRFRVGLRVVTPVTRVTPNPTPQNEGVSDV